MSDFILVQFIIISLHAAATVIWRTLVEPEPVTHTFFFSSVFFRCCPHPTVHQGDIFSAAHVSLIIFPLDFFMILFLTLLVFQTGPLGPGKKFPSARLWAVVWPAFRHQAGRGDPCVQGGFFQGLVHLDSSAGGGLPQRCWAHQGGQDGCVCLVNSFSNYSRYPTDPLYWLIYVLFLQCSCNGIICSHHITVNFNWIKWSFLWQL